MYSNKFLLECQDSAWSPRNLLMPGGKNTFGMAKRIKSTSHDEAWKKESFGQNCISFLNGYNGRHPITTSEPLLCMEQRFKLCLFWRWGTSLWVKLAGKVIYTQPKMKHLIKKHLLWQICWCCSDCSYIRLEKDEGERGLIRMSKRGEKPDM